MIKDRRNEFEKLEVDGLNYIVYQAIMNEIGNAIFLLMLKI